MNGRQYEDAIDAVDEFELLDGGRMPVMLVTSGAPPAAAEPAGAMPAPGPPFIPPILLTWRIAGTEATQATQFFLINGQGSGAGPDNSVPMVARKELILRVYPRTGALISPAQVTGIVSRPGKPDLTPINGPVPVQPISSIQRGNTNHSLNFRVPAADCVGNVTFTAKLIDTADPSNFRTRTMTLTFDEVPPVRVHGVLIHYTGRGLNITAPTGIDLINTLVWVGRTYPISGFAYTACDVVDFNGDLTVGGGGGCGTGWNQLFNTLWNMRVASGTNDVFVGLLPTGVPTSGVIGCGGGGVAIAYVGGGSVFAQEIGHAFGRAHAPCGNPGSPDPNYPTYDSYPSGSIGEFGVDTSNMQVFNPSSTYDYMSYCGPVWTSPYTYIGLKNAIAASPAMVHPERAGSRLVAGEHLFLNFRMHKSGKVELLNSFHLYTDQVPAEMGEPGRVGCDLLSEGGEVIASHHCRLNNPHMDEEGPYADYHEVVRWCDTARTLVFTRDGAVCHELKVEDSAPEVAFTGRKQVDRRPDLLRLEWSSKRGAPQPVHYLLRYSNDGGTTWRSVAADLVETHYVVSLDALPGGQQCMFQVIASSGIRTATATTDPFAAARKPRQAQILSPAQSGVTFKQGEDVVLLGGGFSPDFGTTEFDEVVWTSDRDGWIGTGYQVITHSLSAGRHRIGISFTDGLGGEASASVFITIE
jgi:hypothetical protein